MDAMEFRKAANALRALWSAGNSYLEDKEPWKQVKTDVDDAALTLRTAMNSDLPLRRCLRAADPSATAAMRGPSSSAATTVAGSPAKEASALDFISAETPFVVPPVMFTKLTDDDLAAYREQFGAGSETDCTSDPHSIE